MQKTVTLKVSVSIGGRVFQFPVENFVVKPGLTSQALLERIGIPGYVLIRINRGLVLPPEAEIYPHINNDGEEFVAAEIPWPKIPKPLRGQRNGRIRS